MIVKLGILNHSDIGNPLGFLSKSDRLGIFSDNDDQKVISNSDNRFSNLGDCGDQVAIVGDFRPGFNSNSEFH